MGFPKLFKKKQKETENKDQNSEITENENKKNTEGIKNDEYKIILKEKLGKITRTIRKPFNAKRYIDVDNHVVLLVNEKLKFVEIFPEEIKDFNNYDQEKIKTKLEKLKLIMQSELDEDTEINEKDVEFEIRRLEAIIRGFEFKEASYITFGEDGQPEFTFLREGSNFHPFKWDTDTKSIYTPSDNKKKSAILSLRNKETKYGPKNIVETSTIIILFLGVLLTLGNLWGGYKIYQTYDQSKIAELERQGVLSLEVCSGYLQNSAEQIKLITDDLSVEYFTKNVTVMDIPDYLKK